MDNVCLFHFILYYQNIFQFSEPNLKILTRNHWNHVSGFQIRAFRSICTSVCVCMRRMLVQRIGLTSTPPTHLYVDLFFQSKSTESFSLSLSDALQTNDNKIEFSHMINSQQICDAHVYNVSMKRMLHH